MTSLTADPLLTTDRLIRDCYHACDGAAGAQLHDIVLDLPALAAAFGRRLREAGMDVTLSQCEQCARSLGLARPASRSALYWTTRAVFVTSSDQAATFDRAFRAVFGAVDAPRQVAA